MTESLPLDRGDFIAARSDGMTILIGRAPRGRCAMQKNDHHQILVPGTRSAAVITHPTAAGLQEQTRINDRHVSIIPAGHEHYVDWTHEAQHTCLLFDPSYLGMLARQTGTRFYEMVPQFASVDPFIWHTVRGIERQMQGRDQLEKSYVESIAVVLGRHVLRHYADMPTPGMPLGGLPRHKLRRAIDFIRAHYREDIGFRDIASELDMSPYHFARMFKDSTGESPHQFIMRCRIEAAKKLLIGGEMPITDIALEVGYKSQSYFTTRFAMLVGMTPAAFRGAP